MSGSFRSVILLLLLFFGFAAQAASPDAILQELRAISFPLYGEDVSAGRQCIGFAAAQNVSGKIVYDLTAGHCMNNYHVKNTSGRVFHFPILGQVFYGGKYEFLHSMVPQCMVPKAKVAKFETALTVGHTYYTLGQKSATGADPFDTLGLVTMQLLRDDHVLGLVFQEICPKEGCQVHTTDGISGAPIVDDDAHVVALYKGYLPRHPDQPLATRIDVVLPFVVSAAENSDTINAAKFCPTTSHGKE